MSTLSVSPGYQTIEEEFEASLRKAFVDKRMPRIAIYSRRQQFQFESAAFGEEKGWLRQLGLVQLDEQSSEFQYELTAYGKRHFGIGGEDKQNG